MKFVERPARKNKYNNALLQGRVCVKGSVWLSYLVLTILVPTDSFPTSLVSHTVLNIYGKANFNKTEVKTRVI